MTGVNLWSTTPANNVNANTGVNWDEGMSPGAVNNSARAIMTDIRNMANDLIWFQYGKGDGVYAPVYASGTTFTIAGADLTVPYHIGRRVKAVGSTTTTIYGTISNVAFSTNTTVTVVWDSGSLANETLTIYLSQVPVTGSPVPQGAIPNFGKPYLKVSRNASQSFSSATAVKVAFDTITTDTGSYWDSTNKRYTPLVAGRYQVSFGLGIAANGTTAQGGFICLGSIYLNGAAVGSSGIFAIVAQVSGSSVNAAPAPVEVQMNGSSDYIEGFVYTDNTSAAITGSASVTYMYIHYIGP